MHTGFWFGSLKERCHLEYLGIYWMTILKWILRKMDRMAWNGLICSGWGRVAAFVNVVMNIRIL
jgi:hypothetical protein